jgi:hypothetical protein
MAEFAALIMGTAVGLIIIVCALKASSMYGHHIEVKKEKQCEKLLQHNGKRA